MLSVLPEQSVSMERQEMDLAEPTSQVQNMNPKQVQKRKLFTLPNILIFLVAVAILGCGTYYLLNTGKEIDVKSSISQSHDKIISNADSSKKDGSNSGSASSKSSTSNNKPNTKSVPASKGVISSNPGLTGGKSGSGDEPPNDDEDNGDKRDKKLKKGSSTSGGSTVEDSEEEDDDDEEENVDDGVYWVDTKLEGNNASPLVGKARP